MEQTEAVIIFTDIRGFTKWSGDIEAFQHIDKFINDYFKIVKGNFSSEYIKKLGDGAMIVREVIPNGNSPYNDILKEDLQKIKSSEDKFTELCTNFSKRYGYKTELALGWGIVRGVVKKIDGDYIGANINKCARLCGIARPFGIIIEKDDFPLDPSGVLFDFFPQIRKLEGIADDVNVWATKEIATQFIPREKKRECPEVHVAGICVKRENNDISVLVAKRNSDRKLYPDIFECGGGQLASSESFTDGVKRHFSSEMHIEVDVKENIYKLYEIKQPGVQKIPGIEFLCEFKGGKFQSNNHSEHRWVTEEQLELIPEKEFIPGIREDIIYFIEQYRAQYLPAIPKKIRKNPAKKKKA